MMSGEVLDRARHLLSRHSCSCVIISVDGRVTTCHRRGIIDLYELLQNSPGVLDKAVIADKVVGKGAAALMALGHVAQVHARVMSSDALALLAEEGITASYDIEVASIINRAGTGRCPVETMCLPCTTAVECLPYIRSFIHSISLDR